MEKELKRKIINYKSRNSKKGYEFDINKQKISYYKFGNNSTLI